MIYQHSQVMIFSRFKFPEAYKVHPNIFAWLAILLKVSDSVWQAADNFVLGCKEIQENCKDEKMCENYNVITLRKSVKVAKMRIQAWELFVCFTIFN